MGAERCIRDRPGPERFRRLSYEPFCERPAEATQMVATGLLGLPASAIRPVDTGLRFTASRSARLDPAEFRALEAGLAALEPAPPA